MGTTGSGTMSPITAAPPGSVVLDGAYPNIIETALGLEGYWNYLQVNECAGRGIRNFPTSGQLAMGCGIYWNQDQRHFLSTAISKAESRMEADRWLGFPIRRKYYSARQMAYQSPTLLGKHLRGVGVETNTYLDTVSLSLRTAGVINDPVTFTLAVTFTDVDELIICYPNTLYKIRPSFIDISSGVATVKIPRSRLLRPEYYVDFVNDNERPNYITDANFLDSVDVYRNYLDTSTGANLVWWRHTGGLSCLNSVWSSPCEPSGACADIRQLACPYITNQRMGSVQLEPATYSSGWSKSAYAVRSRNPDGIEINYMRGFYDRYDDMEEPIQRAIIAWAHTNLPDRYCARCEIAVKYWQEDNQPVEPNIRIASGRSVWGNYYAEQLIREFDTKLGGAYRGGLMF